MSGDRDSKQNLVLKTIRRKRGSVKRQPDASGPERTPHRDNDDPMDRPDSLTEEPGPGQREDPRDGLHYCFGEIDFVGSGMKRGKALMVAQATPPGVIFDVLMNVWHLPPPNLVISLVGEEDNVQMKARLRAVLRKGLVTAAQSTGAWILTGGLRVGISGYIGQAVRDLSLASTSTQVQVVAIGIASLGRVSHGEDLARLKTDTTVVYKSDDNAQGPRYSLDPNHSHFILVEPTEEDRATPGSGVTGGSDPQGGPTGLRLALEKHISEQRTGYGGTGSIEIPVLCLLVNGGPGALERIWGAMEQSAPWLILAGSGGIADVVASLTAEGRITPQLVSKHCRDRFPTENFPWEEVTRCTRLLQNIISQRHLLTVYDFEQEGSEELNTVMLKALVKACKSHSQEAQEYLDELKLAVAWNRVDIAKSEIFNGDVEWKSCDLEEVLMDALVNDKPDFVRLFVDNGADVLHFLTYSRLQDLYRSVSPKTLLFHLLSRKREPSNPGPAAPAFSLHDVARVLKDFLHDASRGFYPDPRAPGPRRAEKRGAKRPSGPRPFLDMNQKSGNPWRDLFLWAVLQNRHEMANYFWTMGQEGVAAALAACKILKEMARLETEAEAARSMKEANYEQLALDLFTECYSNSEDRAFALLVRRNRDWNKATCLHLAAEADTKAFFAHEGVQAFLTKIWWGDMATSTPILSLLCAFSCPVLIYTNLITFRSAGGQPPGGEETSMKNGPESPKDQDGERAWLFQSAGPRDDEEATLAEASGVPGRRGCGPVVCGRWRQFWGAPVTVFLGNVIMYFAFLFLFAYVLLLDFRPPPPQGPSGPEVTLYCWVFTLVLEEIRQGFFTDQDSSLGKMFGLYVEDNWNKCDLVALFLFILGISCRMVTSGYQAGRTILAIDFMVFTLRLIHIFAIHKQLGPKIIIVERMMKDVFFFLFFLSVWLIAYGVTIQALLHPDDSRLEWIFRRVLYRPYLQIFGQIPLDEMDVARINCSSNPLLLEDSPSCPNGYANWLVILLLVIFLLVTNVLLMNLLIAMFSYTFQLVQGNADMFWKFQRYSLIVEYHSRPALAPPFILFSHIRLLLQRASHQVERKQEHLVRDLPEALEQRIITWETVQKESLLARLDKRKTESNREVLKKISNKVELIAKYLDGLREQERRFRPLEPQVAQSAELSRGQVGGQCSEGVRQEGRPAALGR
ncbi:transient receptor potential cation channel subfamily M member 5 [Tachyglossus aculeatus]|uniref:transient receptor potential cation channel subfamily M member 5 n=1 Tax=Tachyglossus aculeatus TaxID=9261 RepID=UPI0018F5E3F0|nr:transient receptor potential cation channel subfamily M member 5 [Tachyglossus aculeatus]